MEQLSWTELEDLQHRCGQTLNFECCCKDDLGSDAKCSLWSSHGQLLETDVAGKHVWLNAPFAHMHAYIKHYLDCKGRDPHHTCACIVVPKGAGHWKQLLSGMEVLHEYGKGECMLSANGNAEHDASCIPCKQAVQAWYDPPQPAMVNAGQQLTMQFWMCCVRSAWNCADGFWGCRAIHQCSICA